MSNKIDYNSWYKNYIAQLTEKVRASVKIAYTLTCKEWFAKVEERVKKMFTDTIDEFYSSYTPDYYDRVESLYNILETTTISNGLSISFNPDNMTSFRNGYSGGDGLYDQVFRKGWHGGAGQGKDHPDPGTPYWRTPVGVYKYWGRPADVANIPPLDAIKKRVYEYNAHQKQADWDKIWMTHIQDIGANL